MKVWWLLSLMILASALPAEAALCTLVWNANPESDVAGYRVYHSYSSNGYTMGSYSYSTQATFATCEDMEIGMDGKLHYWTVTAYDTSGNESPFPAEVWMQMPLLTESAPIPVPDLDAAPASLPPPPSPNCWWIFFRVCP
jgi:fibronectin type 3 domain-containing protein